MSIELPMEGTHTEDQFYAKVAAMAEQHPEDYGAAVDMVSLVAKWPVESPLIDTLCALAWIGVIVMRDDGDRSKRLSDRGML